jgi:hypothetical protein
MDGDANHFRICRMSGKIDWTVDEQDGGRERGNL